MEREQFTIRAPKALLDRVREEAAAYGDSMNDVIVAAVEREVARRAPPPAPPAAVTVGDRFL